MRDFFTGRDMHVKGDINITDNSQQYKPLNQCTIEELVNERQYRTSLLKKEQRLKLNRLGLVLVVFGIILAGVALFYYLKGRKDISSLILGLGGILVGLASYKAFENPTEFEGRQISALNEIKYLLREHGIE